LANSNTNLLTQVLVGFRVTNDRFPDIRQRSRAALAVYSGLLYGICWLAYALVYLALFQHKEAAFYCAFLGIPTALLGLAYFRVSGNIETSSFLANFGGALTVLAIAWTTGGAFSPALFFTFVPISVAFLLQSSRASFINGAIIGCMAMTVCLLVQPLTAQDWNFYFPMYGLEHRLYNGVMILCACIVFSLVCFVFTNKISQALLESNQAREQIEVINGNIRGVLDADTEVAQAIFDDRFNIVVSSAYFDRMFAGKKSMLAVIQDLEFNQEGVVTDILKTCFGLELLSFEVNLGSLPDRVLINGLTHKLHWRPILDRYDQVQKIVFTASNIEALLQAQKRASELEKKAYLVLKIVELHADKVSGFINRAKSLILEAENLEQAGENRLAYINLHTVKGSARTLGFDRLATTIHHAEQHLNEGRSIAPDIEQARHDLHELHTICQEIGFSENLVTVSRREAEFALLRQTERDFMLGLIAVSLEGLLLSFTSDLPRIARELNKNIPELEVECPEMYLTRASSDALQGVFVHVFRNSLDHGIETVDERLKSGKNPQGRIHVKAAVDAAGVTIQVRDDGQGLHLGKIRSRAIEQGIIKTDENLDRPAIAQLIFRAGLSTARAVTMVSGRGVGMDAVKSNIEALGGRVEIELDQEADLTSWALVLHLPRSILYSLDQDMQSDQVA